MKLIYLLFILLIYITACLGIGGFLVKFLSKKTNNISPAAYLSTSFLLGQGLIATIWLCFSLGGIFTLPVIICFLLLGISCFYIFLRQQIPLLARQFQSIWLEFKSDRWEWKVIAILATILFLEWGTSLGRSLLGDASAFYFALPKVIAASHRLVPLPGYVNFMYVGFQGEMHYAALMALGSADAAQLFAWPTIFAGAILLLALGRQIGLQRQGQWVAFIMVFTSSCVIWLSGDGKTDLFAVSLGLATYFWTMQTWKNKDRLSPWLIGLFAGFAVTAKFSYIPVLLPGIALIICWSYFEEIKDSRSRKNGVVNLLITSGIILASFFLAMAPHMIKNTIFFQNPLAPIGQSSVSQIWFSAETTRRILLTYPLALTFGSYWAQYGDLSPLLLAFLPLGLILGRPRNYNKSPLFICTMVALLGLIIWMISEPSVIAPRYFMPTLLLFILMPSKGVDTICQNKRKPWFLYSIVVFSIFGTIISTALYFNNLVFFPTSVGKFFLGEITECDRTGEYCHAMETINKDAALGDRLFLASYHRYWLRPDLLQCVDNPSDTFSDTSAENYWSSIYQNGFRYLLIDHSTHTIPFITEVPIWLKLTNLYEGSTLSVYRLDYETRAEKPLLKCIQQKSGAWDVVPIN